MTRRLGLRREVLILLPMALLLLVVLSTFTLFSYRGALDLLIEERRGEAVRLARFVAARLASRDGAASPGELAALAPGARGVALLGPGGEPLVSAGELPPVPAPAPAEPAAVGPGELLPGAVAGFARFVPPAGGGGEGAAGHRIVRVDLPARELDDRRRSAEVLTVFVLAVNSGLVLLVLVYLRHLLVPYEALLERARQVSAEGPGGSAEGDEAAFLVATFERALAALAERSAGSPDDDIAALERTLSASLQSGLLLLDGDGRVLALNAMGAELLGAEAPAPGTPLAWALPGQPELVAVLEAAVAERRTLRREECRARSPRGPLTLGLTAHPLRRDDGEVRGHLVLFADLTEVQRRAEEARLAESLSRLGEMAGGVAHELRNSLATLRGYLTLIERRPDEDSIADFLEEIRREADHLERVLEDFLAFARPGTARMREFPLAGLLARAAADPALEGFPVELRGEAAGLGLRGDPQLLERALRNLLRNAVEAEREAGRCGPVAVHLRSGGEEEEVEIAVEDRGPGLPPEIRERLFHPFATGRPGGVGLGLALAHRIVVLHGGRIRLEDRPGGGTRACITFPADTIVTLGNDSAPPPASSPGP